MEAPGFLTLLYIMVTLPEKQGLSTLPWGNWVMGGMFVGHLHKMYIAWELRSRRRPITYIAPCFVRF